jgi:hypothetical protein
MLFVDLEIWRFIDLKIIELLYCLLSIAYCLLPVARSQLPAALHYPPAFFAL